MNPILESLARSEGFPRVSIYIPTHRTFPDHEQDPIRFTKALGDVVQQLAKAGMRNDDIATLLGEAAGRGKEVGFWTQQEEGLAVFIEEGATHWVNLPGAPAELAIVSSRYHVRPLIGLFQDLAPYYVLAVSSAKCRFLRGTIAYLREIKVVGMPEGLDSLKESTDFDAHVGYHARDRGGRLGGSDAPKYAALGESPEDYKEVLLEHYCRDVAKAADRHLAGSDAPLVLAALPRTLGRLRQYITHAAVIETAIDTDPQSLVDSQLHEMTRAIAKPILKRQRSEAQARLEAAREGSGAAHSYNLQDVVKAAEDGRVETLFLDQSTTVWGHYDPVYRLIRIDHISGPNNEDLLNLAALRTLMTGGNVQTLPDSFPGPVAALYRY